MKSAILLVVILGILVGAGLYSPVSTISSKHVKRVEKDVSLLEAALRAYKTDAGKFPTTEQGLAALVHKPTARPIPRKWKATMKKVIQDPWERDYHYRWPGVHNPETYDVWSLGPDGIESIDDIGNWE